MSVAWWIVVIVGVTFCTFGDDVAAVQGAAKSGPLYHYEYSRIQEEDQRWKCWNEGYRPPKATSNKVHELGNGTAAELQRILRFNQSSTVLFMFSSNSDNQNLHNECTIEANKLVRLTLDNAGLEKLEISFPTLENDCRLADLSVPRNRLTVVPLGLERLTALRKLDLSYNLLESFNLNQLSKATGIKQLLLSHNRLESFLTAELIVLDSLHKLDLSNNRLRTLDATLWNLPRLETFHVDHNRHLATIAGWSRVRFPLVKGFDPTGTNNWNQTWLKSVQ
ncbi:leucine-rich repeat-containing protein 40-like [Anopheles ziemanni]|uniref:leucine-rich repeat-containing protein 40-like n=1 Tax=Anopheles coustani TaxID=139045 RepID=UPI00265B5577|nr:leucine-rich repeat-containing protein 40-like [Anopheles coustani]XP_058170160.1 leucine-rich repeat-containing protein 40-like [Anopheles ziemanni]